MSPLNSSKTFMPPHSGVTVRMYNPGFGDCLLLAFRGDDGHARYTLIDCGVHHQYPDHEEKVKAVAADIAEATNNRLHLVVATHEHSDHLSGFIFAKDIFDQIEIEDLWMAWTEDPNDKVALDLKGRAHKVSEALTAVVGQLDSLKKPLGMALQGVLEFEMKKDSSPLNYLRSRSRKKIERAEDYRRPG
jgi:glyoxylase-like metal-dependent hydrolase (beta-lactamase superfamily II)